MKLSEFRRAMAEEFGEAHAGVLARDHWLAQLDGTVDDALTRGVRPREAWIALCEDLQIPVSRRHGRGLVDPPS
ncbi:MULTISPECIES: DUF3046 domain-containing protein [unclassified Leucobacter]|uniref:DUF3046 domain-containing protein n=1 Tax=unclassified Leucobacter TaxID=2621730 RepID=UPI00165E660C|nr:DUF3046 domain-containing protein [Leucobacter sp. CX169]MBC9925972.1 DUF3046 domain-containing protein [Leucobacter sp. cx-169]MBC9935625.1 DUF3046 domain-containing protein [Leucobacter sp. cx-87]